MIVLNVPAKKQNVIIRISSGIQEWGRNEMKELREEIAKELKKVCVYLINHETNEVAINYLDMADCVIKNKGGKIKLSDVIKLWDILHVKDVGKLGFCDLDKALEEVVGVENDLPNPQPIQSKP